MCRITDIYFASCNHWGSRRVESSCIGADYHGLESGCWNTTLVGTTRLNEYCPTCLKYAVVLDDPISVDRNRPSRPREHVQETSDEGSRSSMKSLGADNSSASRGSLSGSEISGDTSHTCSDLSIDVVEEERLKEGTTGEELGKRFGGWINYNASSEINTESPWKEGWNSGLGIGEEGFGKRFGGWVHLNAPNFKP